MAARTDSQTHTFPEGSEVEVAVRTSDATTFRVFTADVARRFRRAQRTVWSGPGSRAHVSPGPGDTRQSTRVYDLPGGEATVSVDASKGGSHAYLHSLVQGAVEYTNTLHVEVGRAMLLAVGLLGSALALVAAGRVFLSVPLFGAGGTVALHLAVYWLSARGIAPNLSQVPEPDRPRR